MLIKIKDIIGEYCSQRQNGVKRKGGEAVREIISANWEKEQRIEISFEGVKLTTPSFIDEAFGKLALTYQLEQLKDKLIFLHADTSIKEKINKTIELRLKQREYRR